MSFFLRHNTIRRVSHLCSQVQHQGNDPGGQNKAECALKQGQAKQK